MGKKIFIISLGVILGSTLLFSRINFVWAQCPSDAIDCEEYCSDPCDPDTGVGLNQPGGYVYLCPPTGSTTLEDLLDAVINYIFVIATAITPILVIIGGFYFMTSGGEVDKVNRAKKIIWYTVIGYAIILFARGLVTILADILGA